MKKWQSMVLILSKLSALCCFSVMPIFASMVSAQGIQLNSIPTCHQAEIKKELSQEKNADCDHCKISEKSWSQPLVFFEKIKLQQIVFEVWTSYADLPAFAEKIETIGVIKDPPPVPKIFHSYLISQKGIVLII